MKLSLPDCYVIKTSLGVLLIQLTMMSPKEKATHSSLHCLHSSPALGEALPDCKGDMHHFPFDLPFQRNPFSDSATNFHLKQSKTCTGDVGAVWLRRKQTPNFIRLGFIFYL